ncbi:MAG: enoyl-CoA hydratase/isomerase family protein [Polyangiaceae bacterium]
MSHERSIEVEARGPACIVTIARPQKKNALSRAAAAALADAIEHAARDESVRGIVIAARGDVWIAGGDLGEFVKILDEPGAADEVIAMGQRLRVIERAAVPVLAAISGDVYGGGCELALLCDDCIVERHVRLSFRHAAMGLAPAWGGAARLCERVGPLAASRLLYTARAVSADEAFALRLVGELVDTGRAVERACEVVAEIARHPREVIAEQKHMLRRVREVSRGAAEELEAETFRAMWGKPAHRAALRRPR